MATALAGAPANFFGIVMDFPFSLLWPLGLSLLPSPPCCPLGESEELPPGRTGAGSGMLVFRDRGLSVVSEALTSPSMAGGGAGGIAGDGAGIVFCEVGALAAANGSGSALLAGDALGCRAGVGFPVVAPD